VNARGTRRPKLSRVKASPRIKVPKGPGGPTKTGGCCLLLLMALGDVAALVQLFHHL